MSKDYLTNVAASVRQKLLNRARKDCRPFHELLQYYAMERFLYRLSCSDHSDLFVLKGAMMLRIWSADDYRSTMDIDMLGRTSNNPSAIESQIREILSSDVPSDGLIFLPDTIQCTNITEDADYKGVRVRFQGVLESARIAMQIDIGFGDIVYPAPEMHLMPTFLDHWLFDRNQDLFFKIRHQEVTGRYPRCWWRWKHRIWWWCWCRDKCWARSWRWFFFRH